MKKFGSRIKFWQPNYKSELVYSSEIPHGQAIETAFEVAASESKRVEEAALVLHRIITESHKESVKLPWPPSSNNLFKWNSAPSSTLGKLSLHFAEWEAKKRSIRKEKAVSWFICTRHMHSSDKWAMGNAQASSFRNVC